MTVGLAAPRRSCDSAPEPTFADGDTRYRSRILITDRGGSPDRVKLIRANVDFERQLYLDALQGLTSKPKELSPKWFYDDRGSALFEAITRLPEYYLTSCEREILQKRSGEIAELVPAETLIELGSGTSEKTRLLLRALGDTGRLRHFVAFDVDE